MNRCQHIPKLIALCAFMSPSSVLAGELGTRSRDTVSISVTIPTRLQARLLRTTANEARNVRPISSPFCVTTNRPTADYSVYILSDTRPSSTSIALSPANTELASTQSLVEQGQRENAEVGSAERIVVQACPGLHGNNDIVVAGKYATRPAITGGSAVTLLVSAE